MMALPTRPTQEKRVLIGTVNDELKFCTERDPQTLFLQ